MSQYVNWGPLCWFWFIESGNYLKLHCYLFECKMHSYFSYSFWLSWNVKLLLKRHNQYENVMTGIFFTIRFVTANRWWKSMSTTLFISKAIDCKAYAIFTQSLVLSHIFRKYLSSFNVIFLISIFCFLFNVSVNFYALCIAYQNWC
jgi:hypothetical protein